MQALVIKIHNSIDEAVNWNKNHPEVKVATLAEAHVVRSGMENGKDTVDLVFKDADGNSYVALVTATILKSLTDVTNTVATK